MSNEQPLYISLRRLQERQGRSNDLDRTGGGKDVPVCWDRGLTLALRRSLN